MDTIELSTIDTKYGRLLIEGHMTFKKETENGFNNKCYILIFQRRLFAFETRGKNSKNMFWLLFGGKPCEDTKEEYDYLSSVPITNSMSIKVEKLSEGGILTVYNLRDFLPVLHDSFNIKLKDDKALEELKAKIQKLIDNASPRPTEDHQGHEFSPFIKHHIVHIGDPKPPPKCSLCKHYFFGQLLIGYKCNTCSSIYHEKCFLEGNSSDIYGNYKMSHYTYY